MDIDLSVLKVLEREADGKAGGQARDDDVDLVLSVMRSYMK